LSKSHTHSPTHTHTHTHSDLWMCRLISSRKGVSVEGEARREGKWVYVCVCVLVPEERVRRTVFGRGFVCVCVCVSEESSLDGGGRALREEEEEEEEKYENGKLGGASGSCKGVCVCVCVCVCDCCCCCCCCWICRRSRMDMASRARPCAMRVSMGVVRVLRIFCSSSLCVCVGVCAGVCLFVSGRRRGVGTP
jgi:hypothetical protein